MVGTIGNKSNHSSGDDDKYQGALRCAFFITVLLITFFTQVTYNPMKLLNGLSRSEFLDTHWQKKPLVIREAIANFQSPLTADELAGLACEEDIESRIIIKHAEDNAWQCEHGPIEENRFESLPDSDWSLLVQSVDHHLPDIASLLEQFDFLPNWRIDDVMFSYAPVGGNVGPHLDNYDVFLLQAQGKRHWHINETDYMEDDFIAGLELNILQDFTAEQDWILEPGDMLYLPPGVAHHGIALDDCITISIGFRAPTDQDLLIGFSDHLIETRKPFFYTDPELQLQQHAGEIEQAHIDYLHQLMMDGLVNDESFARWFGQYITEPKLNLFTDINETSFEDFEIVFKQHDVIHRRAGVRISFIKQQDHIALFVAGHHKRFDHDQLEWIHMLSRHFSLEYRQIKDLPSSRQALQELWHFYQSDWFFFDEP